MVDAGCDAQPADARAMDQPDAQVAVRVVLGDQRRSKRRRRARVVARSGSGSLATNSD
jgi:hypothetical protein